MENRSLGNTRSRHENSGPFVRRQWRVYQYVPKRGYDGQYFPPHLSHLFDAVKRIGQYYLEGWSGEERAARGEFSEPVSPLEVDTDQHEQYRIFLEDGTSVMVNPEEASKWWMQNKDALFQEWEIETAAFKRWQAAEHKLRDFASSGKLPGFGRHCKVNRVSIKMWDLAG